MIDGKDRNDVQHECFNNNYIEIESQDRRRERTNVIYRRLLSLDRFLLSELYNADVATSKFILVYAIAKTDSLFLEFMFEVYREALIGNKDYISIDDFDNFFHSKKESNTIVAGWGFNTINQLSKGYRNILVDSGFGIRLKKRIKAIKPMIHHAEEKHIISMGNKDLFKLIIGVQ